MEEQPLVTPARQNGTAVFSAVVSTILAALIVGGIVYAYERHQRTVSENNLRSQIASLKSQLAAAYPSPVSTPTPTPTPSLSPSASPVATPTPSTTTYATQYLSVNIPAGWTATQAPGNAAAVDITKGKYILYINANATQASGVSGGRFAEIAQGSPSADLVTPSWPSEPCSTPEKTAVNGSAFYADRADIYDMPGGSCAGGTVTGPAWFFSYLTDSSMRYFNYYAPDSNPALVVTMSYDATSTQQLPLKGSAELTAALQEMTDIAGTLHVTGR